MLFEDPDKGIIISADRRGHYSESGMINKHKMEFMIDTGASSLAVPGDLAKRTGLIFGMPVVSNMAAGNVRAYQTTIPTLTIASISLKYTCAYSCKTGSGSYWHDSA